MAADVGLVHVTFACCVESLPFVLVVLRTCNFTPMRLCSVYDWGLYYLDVVAYDGLYMELDIMLSKFENIIVGM
jgi:hypothetical protein